MHHYIAFDTESFFDMDFHRAYQHIDPKCGLPRMASRRIAAASALEFTITDDHRVEFNAIDSWTTHDHGDEEEVVSQLFAFLRERGHATALSWNGVCHDAPLLNLAALEYGLAPPVQLTGGPAWEARRMHFDLCKAMKAGSYVHMSEAAMRIGLPMQLLEGKASVKEPKSGNDWQGLRAHCERDTLILSLIMLSWLAMTGRVSIDPPLARHALLASYRRARPDDPLDAALEDHAEILKTRAFDRCVTVAGI